MGKLFFPRKPNKFASIAFISMFVIGFVGKHFNKAHTTATIQNKITNVVEVKTVKPKFADINCLSDDIYYEASTQSMAGQIAVGEVVLNRVKSLDFPKTVCKVIWQHCQFSWTCSPNRRPIDKHSTSWKNAQSVARMLLANTNMVDITNGAIAYHTVTSHPSWSRKMDRVMRIDQHVFYKI